ncbi:MAG: hypothetical protein V3R15_02245, partial [Qipengyuania citrea]
SSNSETFPAGNDTKLCPIVGLARQCDGSTAVKIALKIQRLCRTDRKCQETLVNLPYLSQ